MSLAGRGRTAFPVLDALLAFLRTEAAGGVVLLAAVVVALAWANSAAADSYEELWHTELAIEVAGQTLVSLDLRHWINDLLMALFFFVVGIEIKRELVDGELRSVRRAALPAAAALGGMALPAAIYLAFNARGEGAAGWGIPMATDIAFAVGVLTLFGRRVPYALKVLLLSIAIVDDIGAILVIALFYSGEIQLGALALAAVFLAGVFVLWRVSAFWSDAPLAVLMVAVWAATFASGVHATIAGVALGMAAPVRGGEPAAGERLLQTLHPWTSFLIVPLFALANAGIALDIADVGDAVASPVGMGIALGLVVGKVLGISGATWLAVRSGLASLPEGTSWAQVVAVAAVAGIGFTVSLFIAGLAFPAGLLEAEAKVGILAGSAVAAVFGSALLLRSLPSRSTA